MILHHTGFPIRISTDRGLFAAPRSFSQLVTSFIGSWCQGIPFMLFLAWTPFEISFLIFLGSLYRLNCCVSRFFSCLIYFALAKLFFTLLERPDFLNQYLFPFLLNFLSLFVYLKFVLFGFQWTFACFRLRSFPFSQILTWLSKYLNLST